MKLAHHKITNAAVAVKIIQKSTLNSLELERVRREIDVLKKLVHPNIAQLYDVIETEDTVNIIMEYVPTTLHMYTMERGAIAEADAHRIFCQLLSAIDYCHEANIIHRYVPNRIQ